MQLYLQLGLKLKRQSGSFAEMRNIWNREITLHHHITNHSPQPSSPQLASNANTKKEVWSLDDNQGRRDNSSSIPEWLRWDTFVMLVYGMQLPITTTTKLRRAHSSHEHSVWSLRVCDRHTLTCAYYMSILHAHTVVSPPHKGLCGAQACNFATCASCNRVIWSTSRYFTTLSPPHTTAKPPRLINWVSFMIPFAGVAQHQTWSQETVKMDQMWCHVSAGLLYFCCKNSNGVVIFCLCPYD